jgi:hypothetical protein
VVHLNSAATEEYNGTSTWTTATASLTTARRLLAGAGTQSAGLAFGGYVLQLIQQQQKNGQVQEQH